MRPWRSILLAGVVLAASGCPTPPCSTIALARLAPPEPVQFVTPGQHVTQQVSLAFGLTGSCNPPTAEEVRAEVTDPKGLPVEATSRVIPEASQATPTGEVSFDVSELGEYHVRAIFEPNLGSAQTDVVVGRDVSAQVTQTLQRQCLEPFPLQNGSFLCGDELLRPDGSSMQLEGKDSAASGDVIWSLGADRLVRYVDTGSGTPSSTTLEGVIVSSDRRFLHATGDELLLLTVDGVRRFVFADGALQAQGELPVIDGEALYRDGNDLWFVMDAANPSEEQVRACHTTIGPDGIAPIDGECTSVTGTLRGVDERGIWISRGEPMGAAPPPGSVVSLSVLHAVQGRLETAGFFRVPSGYWTVGPAYLRTRIALSSSNPASIGGSPFVVRPVPNAPQVAGAAFHLGTDQDDMVLERFSSSLEGAGAGTRGNLVWVLPVSSGQTTLISITP